MKDSDLWNKLVTIDGEDATNRSLCDILRDTDPELEVVEGKGFTEQYAGIMLDYDEWEQYIIEDTIYHNESHTEAMLRQKVINTLNNIYNRIPFYYKMMFTRSMKWLDKKLSSLLYKIYRPKFKTEPMNTSIFLDVFKDVKGYMTGPVALFDYQVIEAKSRKVESNEELIDFINENKDRIIIYRYYSSNVLGMTGNRVDRKIFRYGEIEV